VLHAVGEQQPPPARTVNPALPAELSDLIERLHQKRPADRPASAALVAQELTRLAARLGATTTDWHGSRPDGPRRPARARRVRIAVAGALILVVGALLGYAGLSRLRDDAAGNQRPPSAPAAEPIRIRALDVLHATGINDKRSGPRRVLGRETFAATTADDIKVTARLSRPAYCYLIVFRPDGQDEVLYPQGADLAPELTDLPHYPARDRGKVYGLTDGTGLWLVALVASDEKLPPYAAWRRQHPGGPWTRSDGEPNVVWFDDGNWLEEMTPRGLRNRGGRGEKDAAGTAPIVRVVDWLKAQTGGTASAVAFTVEAKNGGALQAGAGVKPAVQGVLVGDDALLAGALERQIEELQSKDKYEEAIFRAELLLSLRVRVQGEDHWETRSLKSRLVLLKKLDSLQKSLESNLK
jgi:hypothetical protein